MSKLEKAIISLNASRSDTNLCTTREPLAVTLVTLLYLVALLSVPMTSVATLLWFGVYPIVASQILPGGYTGILRRSLFILPFIILVGIFNPFFDRTPAFSVDGIIVTRGWLMFFSILFRGLWAVQAVFVMTVAIGFTGFCRGLQKLGVPKFLTTQLMMVYRYLMVLLEEALRMRRARESRGFGRKSMPLKMWGIMIGELFVRSIDRARNVHSAMLSRGFDGEIPYLGAPRRWTGGDTLYLILWSAVFALLRFLSPEILFGRFF